MRERREFEALLSRQRTEKGDVIFVLQGDGIFRASHAVDLVKKGYASEVAIVGSADKRTNGSFPSREVRDEMFRLGLARDALHFEEVGPNTHGEAKRAMELAKEKGWKTLLIVTSPHHQYRAFLTFLQAMQDAHLNLHLVNAVAPLSWTERTPWGTRKELLSAEFDKIEEYRRKGDVASYEDGIRYLEERI